MNSNRYTPKRIVEEQVCFSIPLYQRLFAWDDVQISGLLNDLKNHFESNADAPYYLGMLSCVASDNRYDLIDGQQRFTVMIFFALVMREYYSQWNCFLDGGKRLLFVSRTRDNEYLKDKIDHQESVDQNEKMKDGIECVERFMKDEFVSNNERQNFSQKVYSSLSFFFSELPTSYARNPSSLNKYFEAMNLRGKNLEQYEILKVNLMRGEINQDVLTRIWNSVCDFDRPLIKMNNPEEDICSRYENAIDCCRKNDFEKLFDLCVKTDDDKDDAKISDINPEQKKFSESPLKRNERYIISFPQFLMMVLDLYLDLSGEYSFYRQELLKAFDSKMKLIENRADFYNQLLFYRLLLDYYVIYKEGDETEDEYNILFKKGSSAEKIKQYQSMFYVSQTPFYIWLKYILKKLHEKSVTNTEELLSLTKERDNEIHPVDKLPDMAEMSYNKKIDRYWFWRLDYYLWERKEDFFDDEDSIQIVDEYVFRMNRSIEHLHPQHQDNNEVWDDVNIHSFGNLAMISQSFNSQQSDDPVTVKFARIKDQAHNHALQSLKLYHMYLLAGKNPNGWTIDVKNKHQEKMYKLLKESYHQL